jgi:hypothetical protein
MLLLALLGIAGCMPASRSAGSAAAVGRSAPILDQARYAEEQCEAAGCE